MTAAGIPGGRVPTAPTAASTTVPDSAPSPSAVAAIERLVAANSMELTRADAKAAVFLAFTGAVLGVFIPLGGGGGSGGGSGPRAWAVPFLWWSAVASALLAVACFVAALAPRYRKGERQAPTSPAYFGHIAPGAGVERLRRAFECGGRDPVGALLSSLAGTSAIIRAKYRWIEAGTAVLLLALPQFALTLRPV
ncbi:Pycsar system effector family protein [Kitasatospora sp. NPDC059811]|uniref:Pycsar system effector family protein n=1 Tax=Streptomycetaceae TaxID=2062 RepID=UPI0007AF7A01|nr:Pycsar system effector family protein [Streptomyces sp. MJM8645]